jgi:glycosyltransferase involved in cell wall biosynthesis
MNASISKHTRDPNACLKPGITTVILTFNEEMHIERAIVSAKAVSRDVLVVDSYSTDRTVELAKAAGARVIQNEWINYSRQFQFALDNGAIDTAWTLRLDADELIGQDLAVRINERITTMPSTVAGVVFNRRHIWMGSWVRHGGRFPLLLLRLWRTGQGKVEDRWMDEHVIVEGGHTIKMDGEFADSSLRDLSFFVSKHNGYAAREAIDVLNQRYTLFDRPDEITAQNSGWQASLKRIAKERIYNNLPFGVGPLMYFLYRYFIQLGFLDGKSGLIYHFMQGFWYRFLVESKVYECEQAMRSCATREERLAVLTQVTGLKL